MSVLEDLVAEVAGDHVKLERAKRVQQVKAEKATQASNELAAANHDITKIEKRIEGTMDVLGAIGRRDVIAPATISGMIRESIAAKRSTSR